MRGLEVWSRGIEWLLAGWLAAAGGVWAVPSPGYEPADEGHLDSFFVSASGHAHAAMAHSFDLPPWGLADRGFRLVVTLQEAIDYDPL